MGEPGFDIFWSVYPRKLGRLRARHAWDELRLNWTEELEVIAAVVYARLAGSEPFPQPATWLRGWVRPQPASWQCPHTPSCPHRAACEVVTNRGTRGA
jgi:hypothetical protein